MRTRRILPLSAVLVVVGAALGTLPVGPASASCVGPQLLIGSDPSPAPPTGDGEPVPVPVPRSEPVPVSGRWFRDGCDDTSTGCAGPLAGSESPLRDVDLVLEQGGSSWTLGTADARGRAQDYAIDWPVRVPAEAAAGPGVLRAAGAQVLVEIGG